MLIWEWRRIFRQKWRHHRPIPDGATYTQFSKSRLILSFVLFFVAWKSLGIVITDKLFYLKDEKTGEERYFKPGEVKIMVKEKRMALDTTLKDRLLTLKEVTQFPLDD